MQDDEDEYKPGVNMQRCPYIHEMKERLLGDQLPVKAQLVPPVPPPVPPALPQLQTNLNMDQQRLLPQSQPVATVVKLNSDGFGSHTSPTHQRLDRTPLMQKEPEDEFHYVTQKVFPKNAKTSLFIIMSFVYAKLLVVVCLAYVISDVVTPNIRPLYYYYEGFFTYLYGASILFLLYVFCFLLQESSCCTGTEKEPKAKPLPKQKSKEKEKENKQKEKEKEKEKKKEEEKKKKEEKEKQKKEKKEKDKKEKDKKDKKQEKGTYRRNSEGVVDAAAVPPSDVPVPVAELSRQAAAAAATAADGTDGSGVQNCDSRDLEAGAAAPTKARCRRKTTQNDHSHGSFFLRIGAIAFGLGTMIYNGLEFGTFFEIPFTSPCYKILKGVNPVLQMIFTFMQMYFIFMNSRLNIHRFKVIARFGLMHVVATNICVWIRTLVLEYNKEVRVYYQKLLNFSFPINSTLFQESIRLKSIPTISASTISTIPGNIIRKLASSTSTLPPYTRFNPAATTLPTTTTTAATTLASYARNAMTTLRTLPTTTTTPRPTTIMTTTMAAITTTTRRAYRSYYTSATSTTPATSFRDFFDFAGNFISNEIVNAVDEPEPLSNNTEFFEGILPQALRSLIANRSNETSEEQCGKVNIMGTIVQDSAPYLYPFIIEYSLIGAAVIYVMWKHIGRNPRYVSPEDLEHRLEVMLSRRAAVMAQAQQGRVDCVGASKGLFFGLLLLVGALICLILFFVLVHHPDFGLLAIYLADVSHCFLMLLSIIAIIVGFVRVQQLKFKTEEQSDLNDILLRISAFGLFLYAVFSVIAGHREAFTREPNLLVMATNVIAVLQVILQLLFIADVSRRRVHLPEHDRSKPGRQVVTFLLVCNIAMWIIYTFEVQKVGADPVQLDFYGFLAWALVQRVTLPLCIFHRFHSAVTLAEIWKTSYKARLE